MPVVEIRSGHSATIKTRDEISERSSQAIQKAWLRSVSIGAKLAKAGWNENDPSTWGEALTAVTEQEYDEMSRYQTVLILELVRSWTLDTPLTEDGLLDLPKGEYEALAKACSDEYSAVPELSPDGVADPKADTIVSGD